MDRSSSRRALVAVVVALLAILAAADLMSGDSILRSIFGSSRPTRQQEMIQEMQRRGLPAPNPRGSFLLQHPGVPTEHPDLPGLGSRPIALRGVVL